MSLPARLGSPSSRLALACLLATLAACAPPFQILTLQPGFDGTRIYRTTGNILAGGAQIHPQVELNLERVDFPRNDPAYYAVVEYTGSTWLHIGDGATLALQLDGETSTLGGPGSEEERRVLHGTSVNERARYPLTADEVARIAGAQTGEVTVLGRAGSVRRPLTQQNLRNLHRFLEQYGP